MSFVTTFLQKICKKVQNINLSLLKLKVNDTFERGQKLTTYIEPCDDTDVVNKAYLDTKLSKIEGHFLLKEKEYHQFKFHNDKHSEDVLIEKALKTTI